MTLNGMLMAEITWRGLQKPIRNPEYEVDKPEAKLTANKKLRLSKNRRLKGSTTGKSLTHQVSNRDQNVVKYT